MPKKQSKSWAHSKPATSYVHPSLSTSKPTSTATAPGTVNGRLEQLRRAHGQRATPQDLSASRYAPRPNKNRRVAGPPPPRSWLIEDERKHDARLRRADAGRMRPSYPGFFPGIDMPHEDSMLHHLLRSIAQDIGWHVEYDRQYLSLLPLEIKSQLLSYVACFGPRDGIPLLALRFLFAQNDGHEAHTLTAAQELRRLDLSGSVARRLTLKELDKSWTKRAKGTAAKSTEVAESWEDAVDLASISLETTAWFPSLTHLSLAYPGPDVSWTDLLSFSRHLSTVTHLSLSGWPRPALPKSAATGSLGDALGTVNETNEDDDARTVLRVFSRNTPSLEWLSVSRCHSWFDDLSPRQIELSPSGHVPPSRQRRNRIAGQFSAAFGDDDRPPRDGSQGVTELGAEWCGTWRHVQLVNVSQEWVPLELDSQDLKVLLQARNAAVQGPRWELDVRGPPNEGEAYRIVAPTEEMQRAIEGQQARRAWIGDEIQALSLAAKIRTLRAQRGIGRCEFEHGWRGKAELLSLGYEEHVLFEAGM